MSDAKGEARKEYHVGKGLLGLAETARVTFFIDGKGVVRSATALPVVQESDCSLAGARVQGRARHDAQLQRTP